MSGNNPIDIETQRAYEIGLVNYIVPEAELASASQDLASELAENAPLAMMAMKHMINSLSFGRQQVSSDLEFELKGMDDALWQTEDVQEGISAFAERRKPEFKGK